MMLSIVNGQQQSFFPFPTRSPRPSSWSALAIAHGSRTATSCSRWVQIETGDGVPTVYKLDGRYGHAFHMYLYVLEVYSFLAVHPNFLSMFSEKPGRAHQGKFCCMVAAWWQGYMQCTVYYPKDLYVKPCKAIHRQHDMCDVCTYPVHYHCCFFS
jgi:hypothetical protein